MSALELKSELFEIRKQTPLFIPKESLNEGVPDSKRGIEEVLDFEGVIGIDFGTSKTKIVISEKYNNNQKQYPVAFYSGEQTNSIENYLLPSFLLMNKTTGELLLHCQVDNPEDYTKYLDIKARLLFGEKEEKSKAVLEAVAFVALCIRHSRSWFHYEHSSKWSKKPNTDWRVNLGMPCKIFEHNVATTDYSLICYAALLLANLPDAQIITFSWVKFILNCIFTSKLSPQILQDHYFCEGDVIPELAAQLLAIIQETKGGWDDNKQKLLIDIGAGTTDVAFFFYRPTTSADLATPSTSIHYHEVINSGVKKLHSNRLKCFFEHKTEFNFSKDTLRMLSSTGSLELPNLPLDVQSYIKKGTKTPQAEALLSRVDDSVVSEYRGLIVRALIKSNLDRVCLAEYDIPTFICGGGARLNPFKNIKNLISNNPNFKSLKLDQPRKLNIPVIGPLRNSSDLDRLSVAYGLSLAYEGIESIGHFNIVREGKKRDDPDEFLNVGNDEFIKSIKNSVFDSSIFESMVGDQSPTITVCKISTSLGINEYISVDMLLSHPLFEDDVLNLVMCDKNIYIPVLNTLSNNYVILSVNKGELFLFEEEKTGLENSCEKYLIVSSKNAELNLNNVMSYMRENRHIKDRFGLWLENSLFEMYSHAIDSVCSLFNLKFSERANTASPVKALFIEPSVALITSDNYLVQNTPEETQVIRPLASTGKFHINYKDRDPENFDSYRGAVAKFFSYLFEDMEDPHVFLLKHMQMPEFKKYQTTINNSVHSLHPNCDRETKKRQSEKIKGTDSWFWAINRKPWEIESCLNLLALHKHKSNYLTISLTKK